jgi:hypothetical protein
MAHLPGIDRSSRREGGSSNGRRARGAHFRTASTGPHAFSVWRFQDVRLVTCLRMGGQILRLCGREPDAEGDLVRTAADGRSAGRAVHIPSTTLTGEAYR